MLCALRHTDVQMNCYPVTKPFHIHRLLCPAVETLDFQDRPDIAIVHLNPDSWNVLTEEQRRIIRSAKKRIGYWVWETDTIPDGWQHELRSVDRIWAPSTYCADVFAAQTGLPVDVVHHPVRLPARVDADRDSMLRRFGVEPESRIILYIFDGASYLVRKNPEALIRAFAASGLAAQGWVLLLKTKHLHDRPEVGKTLVALAERTTGVHILEVSLYADEVTGLLAAADIYASPHCSEGFGLTVAEAMAVGVPVVATDFGGTRDFVDAASGYPVAAEPWTLAESHGHYLAGHRWARINEDALAATLVEAARAVDAGDDTVAIRGRARIADLLSYETVAEAIRASFADLIAESGERVAAVPVRAPFAIPPVPEIDVSISHAQKFGRFTGQEGLVPVSVNDDLSWSELMIPEGRPTDWLVFAPGNARISPEAGHVIRASSMTRPDVTLFYADDVASDGDALNRIRLKPDFDRTLLAAQDYIGAPVIVRRKTYDDVGGLDPARGTAALYDLVLKVAEASGPIARIPEVLVGFDGARPFADIEDRRAALTARKGFAQVDLLDSLDTPGLLLQRRRFADGGYPAVTLAIPTRRTLRPGSRQSYVEHLLERLAETDWPLDRLTVIIGDDIAGEPDWAARPWRFKLRRIETLRPPEERFNYAAKMNQLWREAGDEQIVFMNDDAHPCDAGWLKALVGFAMDRSVGGVGARLHYEDGSIQHAGMFPSLRTIVHAWLGWPADAKTYQDWALAQREWSVVTGAIFATRRSILDQINGFDERFSLEFNDVDLCLRIRNLGYRIVYNPDARFIHAEKASRGQGNPPGEEVALFLSRWSRWLDHDPASHPGLSRDRMDLVAMPGEGAWYRR
jgi:GT2 family glycosyltransferase/glycosyltransferase involved in cell wall biosynthesis